jgi:hypothetical protein
MEVSFESATGEVNEQRGHQHLSAEIVYRVTALPENGTRVPRAMP